MQSIAVQVKFAYPELSVTTINMVSLIYMIIFIPVNFPSNYIVDTYGSRVGVWIGVILTVLGMWMKIFINSGFEIVLIG